MVSFKDEEEDFGIAERCSETYITQIQSLTEYLTSKILLEEMATLNWQKVSL